MQCGVCLPHLPSPSSSEFTAWHGEFFIYLWHQTPKELYAPFSAELINAHSFRLLLETLDDVEQILRN